MHLFPKDPVIRVKWVKFVLRRRVDFGEPLSDHVVLCSVHFEVSCFENSLARKMGLKMKDHFL